MHVFVVVSPLLVPLAPLVHLIINESGPNEEEQATNEDQRDEEPKVEASEVR